ncbi:anti-sigma factor family protein [Candidatus Zixiibacteriota bacterium]
MALEHLTDEQIQEFLDIGAGEKNELVAAHLEDCPSCRAAVAEYRHLYQQLTDDTGFELPADFAASVIAQVAPVPQSRFRWMIVYPVAAALIAVVAALYIFVDFSGFYHSLKESFAVVTTFDNTVLKSAGAFLNGLNLKANLVVSAGLMLVAFAVLERLFFNLRRGKAMFFA